MSGVRLGHLNLRVRDAVACQAFYERWFAFRLAFNDGDALFLRDAHGFLLALVPVAAHVALPPGFHVGFEADEPADVIARHASMAAAGASVGELVDGRPDDDYVSFRCWDPDGTEIEVYWDVT